MLTDGSILTSEQAFRCLPCKRFLWTAVDFAVCPKCQHEMERAPLPTFVDDEEPPEPTRAVATGNIFMCRSCKRFSTEDMEFAVCPGCQNEMTRAQGDERDLPAQPAPEPPAPPKPSLGKRIAPYLYLFSTVIFAGALALDPIGRIFIAPLVVLAVIVAGLFVATLIGSRTELRAIVADRRVRVRHGLEHGCLAILRERGHDTHSGVTTRSGFIINVDPRVTRDEVSAATKEAIQRFEDDDTQIAYSPYCGTSLLVGMAMFASIILGCTFGAIAFGVGVGPAFMAAACLGVVAQLAWRPLGLFAQRALTVSTRFATARVGFVQMERFDAHTAFVVPIDVTL